MLDVSCIFVSLCNAVCSRVFPSLCSQIIGMFWCCVCLFSDRMHACNTCSGSTGPHKDQSIRILLASCRQMPDSRQHTKGGSIHSCAPLVPSCGTCSWGVKMLVWYQQHVLDLTSSGCAQDLSHRFAIHGCEFLMCVIAAQSEVRVCVAQALWPGLVLLNDL